MTKSREAKESKLEAALGSLVVEDLILERSEADCLFYVIPEFILRVSLLVL